LRHGFGDPVSPLLDGHFITLSRPLLKKELEGQVAKRRDALRSGGSGFGNGAG
jgi:hypothetical protein